MPKYKPTTWKLHYCVECKRLTERTYWCVRSKHNILEKPNVPFVIPDLEIDYQTRKGWTVVKSNKMKETFYISPTEFVPVLKGCGVEPGGRINNQWWMWTKKGSSLSLKWLKADE